MILEEHMFQLIIRIFQVPVVGLDQARRYRIGAGFRKALQRRLSRTTQGLAA
jgi:hypothetical protein